MTGPLRLLPVQWSTRRRHDRWFGRTNRAERGSFFRNRDHYSSGDPTGGFAWPAGPACDQSTAGLAVTAAARSRSRCGTMVYWGSVADCRPAWKIPHRVAADAAIRAAPDSALSTRLWRLCLPSSAPTRPTAERILPAHRHRPGWSVLGDRRGEQAEPGRSRCTGADEHERHLRVAVVPGRHGGITDQRCGVGSHRRAQQSRPGRRSHPDPRRPPGQRAGRGDSG
jgi:hypothetical protein